MGFFKDFRFSIENFVVIVLFGLVMLYGISYLLTQIFGFKTLKVGPIFYVFAIAIAVGVATAVFSRGIRGTKFEKVELLAYLAAIAVSIVILFFAKDLVPAIFSSASLELQSMIGLGP